MKNNRRGLTCAILSISLLTVMAGAAMAPALAAIKEHFADESPLVVQLVVSLPALTIIVTNLFFGSLCRLMRTRTLALTGLMLYVAAGAGAYYVDSMGWLLVLRALLGVSVGMVMPLSTGLLAYYFGSEEQPRLMGLSAAMNQLGGVVATLLAGVLATVSWRLPFLVYLLGLTAVILTAAKLPNERLKVGRRIDGGRRLWRFHPSVTAMFLIMVLFFVYPTNFALTAHVAGVGTVATTLVMTGLDVVAFLTGLGFAPLMRRFRRQMKYVAPLMFLLGYGVLAVADGLWLMVAGSVLIGIANGVGVPYVNTIASVKAGAEAATTVMPLLSAALYLGQFVSPLVVSPLAGLTGTPNAPYIVAMGIAVVFVVQAWLTRKQHALPDA